MTNTTPDTTALLADALAAEVTKDILAARPRTGVTLRPAWRAQTRDLIVGASGRVYEVTRRTPGRGVIGFGLTFGAEGEWVRTSADIPTGASIDVR